MIEKTDDELMQAIAQGNQKAFDSLFRRHSSKVLGYSSKLLGSRSLGEDVSQDVWMKVVKMAPSYKGQANFSAWILTMTRNACFDFLRTRKNLVTFDEERGESLPDVSKDSVLEILSSSDEISLVQNAIDELPAAQRTALLLWMTEDLSYEQIAHQLGTTVSSVKSVLFRARETLSERLRGAV
jgi:RNA polymerase sigma-70 factor (ECF subfamily)